MSMSDPIADMLTRIRNAGLAKHQKLDIPSSNLKVALATVLKDLGYIKNFKTVTDDKQGVLRIYLKFDEQNAHVIHEITRISTPGRRVYVAKDEIPLAREDEELDDRSKGPGHLAGSGVDSDEFLVGEDALTTLGR